MNLAAGFCEPFLYKQRNGAGDGGMLYGKAAVQSEQSSCMKEQQKSAARECI